MEGNGVGRLVCVCEAVPERVVMGPSGKMGLQAETGSREEWGSWTVYRNSECKGPEVGPYMGCGWKTTWAMRLLLRKAGEDRGKGKVRERQRAGPCRLFYQCGLCVHV